jgi:hypothetical protein
VGTGTGAQRDVLAAKPHELRDSHPRLHGHEQERPVASSDAGGGVRCGKQGVDLGGSEVGDVRMIAALGGDGEDALDQSGVLGETQGGEREQRVHRCQPGVPGGDSSSAVALEMLEERPDEWGVEHLDLECRRCDASGVLHEVEQQPEAVSIGGNRVRARMTLRSQPLDEECFEGWRQRRHDPAPAVSRRAAAATSNSGEALRYQ